LKDTLKIVLDADFEVLENGSIKLPDELSNKKITINTSTYRMGIGGLHSTEEGRTTIAEDGYVICDKDCASFYPNIILGQGLYPRQFGKDFLTVYKSIVEENPNENLLIAYNYKTDLIRLQEAFPKAIVLDKKGEAVDKWNNGDIKMLLAHPMSAGHGLNLQKGGSVIIWFGLNWSLELYQQFNGRVHRQGQEKPTRIIHIVADGCIDEKVMKAIELKAETQNDLLDRLKLIN